MMFVIRSRKTDEMINVLDIKDKKEYESKHPDIYLVEPQEDLTLFLEDDDY